MFDIILIVLLAIACYSAGYFIGKKKQIITLEPEPAPRRIVPEGECSHRSNKDLNVTAMGDKEEFYLCQECGEKVPASKLVEFEQRR